MHVSVVNRQTNAHDVERATRVAEGVDGGMGMKVICQWRELAPTIRPRLKTMG